MSVVPCVLLVGRYFRLRPERLSVLDRKIFPVAMRQGQCFSCFALQIEMVDVDPSLTLLLDGQEAFLLPTL